MVLASSFLARPLALVLPDASGSIFIESLRLAKISKVIKSNHHPNPWAWLLSHCDNGEGRRGQPRGSPSSLLFLQL